MYRISSETYKTPNADDNGILPFLKINIGSRIHVYTCITYIIINVVLIDFMS